MTEPNANPNDVDRALAAFGATPLKYRSFGRHTLRPSAAYAVAPAIVDDTVFDPFGPQPVVHALDETHLGVLLPANLPSAAFVEPALAGPPFAQPPFAESVFDAEFTHEARGPSPSAPYQPTHVTPPPEVAAYGVPESNSDGLNLPPPIELAPEPFVHTHAAPLPEPFPVAAAPPAMREAAREKPAAYSDLSLPENVRAIHSDVVFPAPLGERPRMRLAPAMPMPPSPPSFSPSAFQAPPFAGPIVSSPPVFAPAPPPIPAPTQRGALGQDRTAAPAKPTAPMPPAPSPAFALPTLGSQIMARENVRIDDDAEQNDAPRTLAEMFRVLSGRPDRARRGGDRPAAEEVSLFRRL